MSSDGAKQLSPGHPSVRLARGAHERSGEMLELLRAEIVRREMTTDELARKLEIHSSFAQHDYTLHMMTDRSVDGRPRCVMWAYAEKVKASNSFIFAFGKGNPDDGMEITDCALAQFERSDRISFQVAGELEDTGSEIKFKRELEDREFASRVSVMAQGDNGGRVISKFSAKLDDLAMDAAEIEPSPVSRQERAVDTSAQQTGSAQSVAPINKMPPFNDALSDAGDIDSVGDGE